MIYNIFLIWFIFIILINIRKTNNSLLSRFRNPNEYVPRDADKYYFPEDIDDDLYADLLQEVPELEGKLRLDQNEEEENAMLPFIKKNVNGSFEIIRNDEEFDTEKDEDQEEYPGQLDYITITQGPKKIISSTKRLPFLTRSRLNSSEEWARRQTIQPERLEDSLASAPRVATCYSCGLNHTAMIPFSPLCHDAFESPDWRARTMARYFRTICYKYKYEHRMIKSHHYSGEHWAYWDNGLIRLRYGAYFGGCFKRFLDVGKVYTQRGCRRWWPEHTTSMNFATHRFTRLEALLNKQKEVCIASPQASLTPFSRSISLYVRYHVCICEGRYCNKTTKLQYSFTNIVILIVILVLTLRHF